MLSVGFCKCSLTSWKNSFVLFAESFYYKRVLDIVKMLSCVYRYNQMIFFFILLIWWYTLNNFQILNQPCILWIIPSWFCGIVNSLLFRIFCIEFHELYQFSLPLSLSLSLSLRHLQHMEVPRLGVESELFPLAYTTATEMPDLRHICNLHHSSGQCQILNPLSKARIEPTSSWILVKFVSTEPLWELPDYTFVEGRELFIHTLLPPYSIYRIVKA